MAADFAQERRWKEAAAKKVWVEVFTESAWGSDTKVMNSVMAHWCLGQDVETQVVPKTVCLLSVCVCIRESSLPLVCICECECREL